MSDNPRKESIGRNPNGTFSKGHKINVGKPCKIETKEKIKMAHLGYKSHQWKGGIKKDHDGYVWEYSPDHPYAQARKVLQHRLVMEQHIGRILYPREVVHHINGIRDDNRIENLKLFENRKVHAEDHFKDPEFKKHQSEVHKNQIPWNKGKTKIEFPSLANCGGRHAR